MNEAAESDVCERLPGVRAVETGRGVSRRLFVLPLGMSFVAFEGTILFHRVAMKLPNGARADLGTKLEDYSLNPNHRQGRHKARVFESVLGITLANAGVLRNAVLSAAASAEAESRGDNGFGQVFVVRFPLTTARGNATVLTPWTVRHGEDFPRSDELLYCLTNER